MVSGRPVRADPYSRVGGTHALAEGVPLVPCAA